jgi:hypothetical protein
MDNVQNCDSYKSTTRHISAYTGEGGKIWAYSGTVAGVQSATTGRDHLNHSELDEKL